MKASRKYQKKKADKLWSAIIRRKEFCEVCDKMGGQPHHVVGRKNLVLRHDLRNGVNLCYTHHVGGNQSAHNDPLWFIKWFKINRAEDYEYLMKRRNEVGKVDYDEKIKELKVTKLDR